MCTEPSDRLCGDAVVGRGERGEVRGGDFFFAVFLWDSKRGPFFLQEFSFPVFWVRLSLQTMLKVIGEEKCETLCVVRTTPVVQADLTPFASRPEM